MQMMINYVFNSTKSSQLRDCMICFVLNIVEHKQNGRIQTIQIILEAGILDYIFDVLSRDDLKYDYYKCLKEEDIQQKHCNTVLLIIFKLLQLKKLNMNDKVIKFIIQQIQQTK